MSNNFFFKNIKEKFQFTYKLNNYFKDIFTKRYCKKLYIFSEFLNKIFSLSKQNKKKSSNTLPSYLLANNTNTHKFRILMAAESQQKLSKQLVLKSFPIQLLPSFSVKWSTKIIRKLHRKCPNSCPLSFKAIPKLLIESGT